MCNELNQVLMPYRANADIIKLAEITPYFTFEKLILFSIYSNKIENHERIVFYTDQLLVTDKQIVYHYDKNDICFIKLHDIKKIGHTEDKGKEELSITAINTILVQQPNARLLSKLINELLKIKLDELPFADTHTLIQIKDLKLLNRLFEKPSSLSSTDPEFLAFLTDIQIDKCNVIPRMIGLFENLIKHCSISHYEGKLSQIYTSLLKKSSLKNFIELYNGSGQLILSSSDIEELKRNIGSGSIKNEYSYRLNGFGSKKNVGKSLAKEKGYGKLRFLINPKGKYQFAGALIGGALGLAGCLILFLLSPVTMSGNGPITLSFTAGAAILFVFSARTNNNYGFFVSSIVGASSLVVFIIENTSLVAYVFLGFFAVIVLTILSRMVAGKLYKEKASK